MILKSLWLVIVLYFHVPYNGPIDLFKYSVSLSGLNLRVVQLSDRLLKYSVYLRVLIGVLLCVSCSCPIDFLSTPYISVSLSGLNLRVVQLSDRLLKYSVYLRVLIGVLLCVSCSCPIDFLSTPYISVSLSGS